MPSEDGLVPDLRLLALMSITGFFSVTFTLTPLWSPSNRSEIYRNFRRLPLTNQEPAWVFPIEALHSLQKHKTIIIISQREECVAFRIMMGTSHNPTRKCVHVGEYRKYLGGLQYSNRCRES